MSEYQTSFQEHVFDSMGELRRAYRFIPARAGFRDFAVLVRKEAEDVFVYVFVRDARSTGCNFDVSLWIAPPESPGDSLDNLYVGYKVRIASEYEVDEQYLLQCQDRIIRFLPCVPAMVPVIRAELEEPAFRTKRWAIYRLEREVLAALLRAAEEGDEAATAALHFARRAVRRRGALRRLVEPCLEAAASLLRRKVLSEDVLQFHKGAPQEIAYTLASKLYPHALGELSAALPDLRPDSQERPPLGT